MPDATKTVPLSTAQQARSVGFAVSSVVSGSGRLARELAMDRPSLNCGGSIILSAGISLLPGCWVLA